MPDAVFRHLVSGIRIRHAYAVVGYVKQRSHGYLQLDCKKPMEIEVSRIFLTVYSPNDLN
jgi:hypothetical protein